MALAAMLWGLPVRSHAVSCAGGYGVTLLSQPDHHIVKECVGTLEIGTPDSNWTLDCGASEVEYQFRGDFNPVGPYFSGGSSQGFCAYGWPMYLEFPAILPAPPNVCQTVAGTFACELSETFAVVGDRCGNGIVGDNYLPEQCDDANLRNGDGCSSTCQLEPGGTCTSGFCYGLLGQQCDASCQPLPDSGPFTTYGYCTLGSHCVGRCGNGVVQSGEQCDDGATLSGDGCSFPGCQIEPESVTADATAFGAVTTDPFNKGATASDPIETLVAPPGGGIVTITETGAPATGVGYTALGVNVAITATPGTPNAPIKITFTYDVSIAPLSLNVSTIQITRNGVPVGNCTSGPNIALPSPCVRSRTRLASNDVQIVVLTAAASDWGAGVATCAPGSGCAEPDSYPCYKVKSAAGQPAFASPSITLADRYLDPTPLDVKGPTALCHPAGLLPAAAQHAPVHQLAYKLKAHPGTPKFVKRNETVVDRFGPHSLTLVRPDQLLDLSATTAGAGGVAPLGDTEGVDRYLCYTVKPAAGAPPLIVPGNIVVQADVLPPGGGVQVKKPSHLCTPVELNGGDAGMAGHPRQLLCYKGRSSTIGAGPVSTNGTFGARVFDERDALAEFCWATFPSDLLDHNLLADGDAESGDGSSTGFETLAAPGWTTVGDFSVVQYGAPGGYPDGTTPGPSSRGTNFFAGGIDAGPGRSVTHAMQSVDVSALAELIQAGTTYPAHAINYTVSGWFGGYATQDDAAALQVDFLDASDAVLGSATIGNVSAADRGGLTALLARSATGVVPDGTRRIVATLTMTRSGSSGYNDGYSDEFSLVLTRP